MAVTLAAGSELLDIVIEFDSLVNQVEAAAGTYFTSSQTLAADYGQKVDIKKTVQDESVSGKIATKEIVTGTKKLTANEIFYEGKAKEKFDEAVEKLGAHVYNLSSFYGLCGAYVGNAFQEMMKLDEELAKKVAMAFYEKNPDYQD